MVLNSANHIATFISWAISASSAWGLYSPRHFDLSGMRLLVIRGCELYSALVLLLIAQGWLVIETTLFVLVYARQTYSNSCLLCASSLKE
jgi:hypothetical protein